MHKYKIAVLFILATLSFAACTCPTSRPLQPAAPHLVAADAQAVVIDTDMAPDDWLAILYLLGRSDVDVKAITVTGTGEAHCLPGMRNALDLVALAGRPEIPVTCGRETPLGSDHAFPASWRESVDNLLGLSLPENPNVPSDEPAVEMLTRIILESPQEVHLITLGPLTNVAQALEAEPTLADHAQMITIMGGAVHVPGNVGPSSDIDNAVAEWNIYADPHAAAIVFSSRAPITLIPLDATNYAPISIDFYRRLEKDRDTSVAEFVYRVLTQKKNDISAGWYYFWDPLAAAIATDESMATFQELRLTVIDAEGPESGNTIESDSGHPIQVAVTVDADRFEALFLDALNGRLD